MERGWVWCVTAGQARHGTVRRGVVRYVQGRYGRSGEVCWSMARRGADWFVRARSGRQVPAGRGTVRFVPARQVGWGEASSGEVG